MKDSNQLGCKNLNCEEGLRCPTRGVHYPKQGVSLNNDKNV